MNRIETIAETPLLRVDRFDHPAVHAHRDPPEEQARGDSLSFLERGRFDVAIGRRRWQLGPGMVFVTWPGLTYRCSHGEERPVDVCLTVSYRLRFVEEIGRAAAAKRRAVIASPTNRLAYLGLRLARLAATGDALAIETLAGELFAEVTANAGDGCRFRAPQLRWYAERVDAVRERLDSQFAEPHSLHSLARSVGMSRFHFGRVFRELAGTPPHRYLLNVRLLRAAERLRAGAGVTETAYECGFGNLSYFIRSFRRRYGVPPSRYMT